MKRNHWSALGFVLALTMVGGTALSQASVLTAGSPPVSLPVAAAPALTLAITAPAEIQIDATSPDGDSQLVLNRDGSTVAEDADSGDGTNARIITFVTPGAYEVQVWEWRGSAANTSVAAMVLPPLTALAAIAPGAPPAVVNAPAGDGPRASSAEVTLTVAAAGNYTIDASATGCDAQLTIISNNTVFASDGDSGGNNNARWTGTMAPGVYGLRVYDWVSRACTITVSATPAP